MPLYEYHCSDCKINFTELRIFKEKDLKIVCPKCGCLKTKRFFSSFSVGGGVNNTNLGSSSFSSNRFT